MTEFETEDADQNPAKIRFLGSKAAFYQRAADLSSSQSTTAFHEQHVQPPQRPPRLKASALMVESLHLSWTTTFCGSEGFL